MRPQRDQILQFFLFTVTLLAFGFGIRYYLKKRSTHSASISGPARDITSEKEGGVLSSLFSGSGETAVSPEWESQDYYEAPSSKKISNACKIMEFRGSGSKKAEVSDEEWNQILALFHESKKKLQKMLSRKKVGISKEMMAHMEKQLKDLKIIRPPSKEEPDLNWRGIGVWTQDDSGEPFIRLGGGFIKLATQQPKRAQFEMTRLVAQSWSPCALKKVDGDSPWEPFTKCLDLHENNACADGSFSEAGWAVSTAIASLVSPPGCVLPGLAKKNCVKKIAQIGAFEDSRMLLAELWMDSATSSETTK